MVRPPRTVSKIGSFMSLSAGSPTQTSAPPRAREPNACSKALGLTAGATGDVVHADAVPVVRHPVRL